MVQCSKTFPLSHKHTKLFAFQFIIFTSYISTPLYIPTHSPSCHLLSNTQTKNDIIYLQSFDDIYLVPTINIVVPSNFNAYDYELTTIKEKNLHFILTDSDNYDFEIKIYCCGLVSFVKAVIDCGVWNVYFVLELRRKNGHIQYQLLFYNIPSNLYFFFNFLLLEFNNYNGYVYAIYNYCFL